MRDFVQNSCKFLWLFILVIIISFQTAQASKLEIPSSPNPVGSGARAIGMGGAFIAIADDATAASWNPGGLIQLETPEVSYVFSRMSRKEDRDFGVHTEALGSDLIENFNINYLSLAYPFEFTSKKLNMIISLNYQHMYDFNREMHYNLNVLDDPLIDTIHYDYQQYGDLYALGLAYCVQITPDVSMGLTLNYWGDFLLKNQWKQKYIQQWQYRQQDIVPEIAAGSVTVQKTVKRSFNGWNANFGFLWAVTGNLTIGGVFKTPFTADIEYEMIKNENENFPRLPELNSAELIHEYKNEKLHMPMSYGMGMAYRFSDDFTISSDIYRTHWDDFEYEDDQGNKTSPISGKSIDESDISSTTWFRIGTEYLIEKGKFVIPLRGGIFYDPSPAEGSPDDYFGCSLGTGLAYERYIFDIAYQFRFGNNVGKDIRQDDDFSQDVREHKIYTSLIVHF